MPCLVVEGGLSRSRQAGRSADRKHVRDDLPPMEEAAAMAGLKALKGCNSKTLVDEYGFTGASITRWKRCLGYRRTFRRWSAPGPARCRHPPLTKYPAWTDPRASLSWPRRIAERRISRDGVAEKVRGCVGRKNVKPKAVRSCRLGSKADFRHGVAGSR